VEEELLFRPVKSDKIYVHVMNQLKSLIDDGSLSPGDRLPPERELASMLAVSRTSVRQAIAVLEAQGVVEMRQGDGTYVVEEAKDGDEVVEAFGRLLLQEQISPREILETRRIVEVAIARICARRASGEHVASLRDLLERRRMAERRDASLAEMNHDLHMAIAEGTENRGLMRVMEVLLGMMNANMWPRLKRLSEQRERRVEEHLDQHEMIVEAIASGDPDLAGKCMEEHLTTIEREMSADLGEHGQ
jgi:GntR family transcriptional repressor for pyruvate dehydrogenase complex